MTTQYHEVTDYDAGQTTGAETITVITMNTTSITPNINNAGIYAEAVIFSKSAANNVVTGRIALRLKRIAGVLGALGAQVSIVAPGGDALAVVWAIGVTGDSVILQVTGVAATTIDHNAFMTLCTSPVS